MQSVRFASAAIITLLVAACASEIRDDSTRTQASAITSASWTETGPLGSFNAATGPQAGRVNAIAFDPVHSGTVYIGAPYGGVWKSSDRGQTFHTVTDHCTPAANCSQWTSLSVSSIALDPTNGTTLYVGTGDAPGGPTGGIGIMKSTDGGTSWTNVSSPSFSTHNINAIAVDPDTPGVVLAADFNCCNPGGTIWRSSNGGGSWSAWTGGSGATWWTGLAFSPLTYVAGGRRVRDVYAVGEGNPPQIWWSNNHGATWSARQAPSGLSGNWQQRPMIAPSVIGSATVWLALPTDNKIFVSRDHGQTWSDMTGNGNIFGSQLTYNFTLATAKYNTQTDAVYAGAYNVSMHIDDELVGGQHNWRYVEGSCVQGLGCAGHADQHAVAADPFSPLPQRVLVGNDGGAYFAAYNASSQTFSVQAANNTLGIAQLWGMGISETNGNVMGSAEQDNGANFATGSLSSWIFVSSGDGGSIAINPLNPNDQYATINFDTGNQCSLVHNTSQNWSSSETLLGATGNNACSEPRWLTAPMVFDPNHPTRLFLGTNYMWRWNVETRTWDSHVGVSSLASSGALDAIAFAPSDPERIYAGAYPTGEVWISRDHGDGGWASLGTVNSGVTSIGVNPIRANQVFVGESSGHVWFGDVDGAPGTWTNLSGSNLPSAEIHGFVFDPATPDTTCYVGTGNGVYQGVRTDSRSTWSASSTVTWTSTGPVNVPVRALAFSQLTGTMSAGTFGRGIWSAVLGTNSRRQYVPAVGALVAWDGQCVDVQGGDNTTSGAQIVTNSCNGQASQHWRFFQDAGGGEIIWTPPSNNPSEIFMSVASDFTLQSVSSMNASYPFTMVDVNLIGLNGYCMDVWGGNLVPGAVVGTYPCSGTANERWNLATDGTLRPAGTNLCVGTQTQPSGPPLLVLQTCTNTFSDPTWRPEPGGALLSGDGQHCIDMDASTFQGHSVPCNGNEEQRWHMHGKIHAGGADCIDVWGASTAIGSTVGVYPCTAGAPNEVWDFYP